MSIVKLEKITLYAPISQQAEIIEQLQELGCVHLVDLGADDDQADDRGDVAEDARRALRYLQTCREQRRQLRREEFDRERIVAETLEIRRCHRELEDERDALKKAIRDLAPWGDFRLPESGQLGGQQFWFYLVPIRDLPSLAECKLIWHEAARDQRFAYVLVLSPAEPDELPGTQVQLDRRPLSQLNSRLEAVEEELDELHFRRGGLTCWCDVLVHDLDRADDKAARTHAAKISLFQGRVFALQGWAPADSRGQIERFASKNGLATTFEPPSPDDDPPTLLHNPAQLAAGENCVTFYKTPGYTTWDPSIVVFFSFAIFFAMILADAGYGALLGVLLAWNWKKMSATPGGRRGRGLLLTLVLFSVVYGVMAGSYFGFLPPLLAKLKIIDVESQSFMMPLSIGIGIAHISLANIVTAWRLRGTAQALSALGWVAIMLGGLAAGMGMLAELDEQQARLFVNVGATLFAIGFASVFLFSSPRPLLSLSLKNHLLRVVDGGLALTRFSSLFGDVLSYLRLFALGLSGAQLSKTFNELAQGAWDSAGFGVLLGILIIFLGHFLNLLLCLMSGVVHGMRLNCMEFFNWSLPEEGYLFKAFAQKARQP